MLRFPLFVVAALASVTAHSADLQTPALIAANTRPIEFETGILTGPGADFLKRETASAQFVLLGENHYLYQVPIFAGALFKMIRSAHGFHHLAVEQDRLAIEDALSPSLRGNARKLGALAHRYPSLFEFASDQDLELLAQVGRLERGPTAICGLEQALGAERYFDKLRPLARTVALRNEIDSLRERAAHLDSATKYSVTFLVDPETPAKLAGLRREFAADEGTRTDQLLAALIKSTEIFGYYRRAEAGEPVGLFNNTVRESWMKQSFMRCYAAMKRSESLPKVMFKFGANHMFHGKNPSQAFPIGNLAHEFAIANGSEAYGIVAQNMTGSGYDNIEPYVRAVLPVAPPTSPVIIDLRSLRPYQRFLRTSLKPDDIENFRALINGYDALLLIPNARAADMKLSGLSAD